jgi:ketosteroid isomerase-like protein
MSQENVTVVQRMLDAYTRGDADGALSCFAEHWVGEDVPDLPDHATYRGREGVLERERHFRETWGGLGLGAGGVHRCGRRHRGRGEGVVVDRPGGVRPDGPVPWRDEPREVRAVPLPSRSAPDLGTECKALAGFWEDPQILEGS